MRHVAIDLETFSMESNAVIVAIGAAEFNKYTGEVLREFYTVIDPDSAIRYGAHVEGGTVMWWMRQSEEARFALEGGSELRVELAHFSEWLTDVPELPDKEIVVYGNGAKFDLAILENSYKMTGVKVPWTYRNEMCGRTLRALSWLADEPALKRPKTPTVGTQHNALDDAKWLAQEIAYVLDLVQSSVAYYEDSGLLADRRP